MQATLRNDLIKLAYDNREYRALLLPLFSGKTAGETTLTERAIRLAYANPELRKVVLPVIKVALDPEYGRGKKPSDKALAHRKKQQEIRDTTNSINAVLGMKQRLIEHYGENHRVKWNHESSRGDDISLSTLIGYATDKSLQGSGAVGPEAKKILDGLMKDLKNENAKKWIVKNGKKAIAGAFKGVVGLVRGIGKASGAVGSVASYLGEKSEQIGGMADKLGDKVEGAFGLGKIAGEALDAAFEDMAKDKDKITAGMKEAFENIGASDAEGLAQALFATKEVGIGALKGIGAGVLSVGNAKDGGTALVTGVPALAALGVSGISKTLGAAAKGVGKVAKGVGAVGSGVSRAIDYADKKEVSFGRKKASEEMQALSEEIVDHLSNYLSDFSEADLDAFESYLKKDGSFNLEKFKKDLKNQEEEAVKLLNERLSGIVEEEKSKQKKQEANKIKKEVAKKKEEKAKKDEAKKKEMKDKFVAKKAVVKMAYENPKYRPQILQLLQVPRTHYAIDDIREIISNG